MNMIDKKLQLRKTIKYMLLILMPFLLLCTTFTFSEIQTGQDAVFLNKVLYFR